MYLILTDDDIPEYVDRDPAAIYEYAIWQHRDAVCRANIVIFKFADIIWILKNRYDRFDAIKRLDEIGLTFKLSNILFR